jgi:hypothetical protein
VFDSARTGTHAPERRLSLREFGTGRRPLERREFTARTAQWQGPCRQPLERSDGASSDMVHLDRPPDIVGASPHNLGQQAELGHNFGEERCPS